jgi:Nuclease-related domain/UvrD-like helicase C-terminal domain/PhoH-like protein
LARVIPEGVAHARNPNKTEQKLAALFVSALPESYQVLANVELYPAEDYWDDIRGEADFVIFHPQVGVIVLEVKGGSLTFNKDMQRWEAVYLNGNQSKVVDPFEQARLHAAAVSHTLIHSPMTRPYASQYHVSYAVWAPYMHWEKENLSAASNAIPDHILLDKSDLPQPEAALTRVCRRFSRGSDREDTLSEEAISAAVSTLERTDKIKYPSLHPLHEDGYAIAKLTRYQSEYIESFFKAVELAIPGAAGTGKTVLAIEMAWRLAEHGSEVLLLCSNPFLVPWIEEKLIRKDLSLSEQRVREHIAIHDITSLCEAVARKSGSSQTLAQLSRTLTPAQFLHRSLNALRKNNWLYDAIIIDEGQEVTAELWSAIKELKRPGPGGRAYFFYDEAQRETSEKWTVPVASTRVMVPLKDNVRNTQHIFDLMMKFYVGVDSPTCHGPLGSPPTYVDTTNLGGKHGKVDGETLALESQLNELVEHKHIRPEDILIVTCRAQKQSRWFKTPSLGRHQLTWRSDGRTSGHVAVSTIRSAKGLERKCVVLTELDGLDEIRDLVARRKKLYIAISRAMLRIIVLTSEPNLLRHATSQTPLAPVGSSTRHIEDAS